MSRVKRVAPALVLLVLWTPLVFGGKPVRQVSVPDLPDQEIVVAYQRAAEQNVLAAINPAVFPGYFSVCADGQGFGFGNSYPSLDGHQMSDALLWLGEVDVVLANWDYVRSFQHEDGGLPLAILPAQAGQLIGPPEARGKVEPNGGLYRHWVPGNPLDALASPTYIQNADAIFRCTQDRKWLAEQLPSINRAADYLASLTTADGAVRGAGYYVERPTRIESDGVAQCHAVDAFRRAAALNRTAGGEAKARELDQLANRIEQHFVNRFWVQDHFGEYLHPQRGLIASHGLTDVDWSAIATGLATADQLRTLWPRLKDEKRFHYGGMPTGISTRPETYEDWEFAFADRHDLAAMGRVWYLEAWARTRMGDGTGLVAGLQAVSRVGKEHGYYWHERYHPDGNGGCTPAGVEKYCEYPANLIRIVQRFLLGVDLRLDGSIVLAPTVPTEYWNQGFGQTLSWRNRTLSYRHQGDRWTGRYAGGAQRVGIRFLAAPAANRVKAMVDGQPIPMVVEDDVVSFPLPESTAEQPCIVTVEIARADGDGPASTGR